MKVAIYCRLSEEDRNKQFVTDDSNSIQNQKAMLKQYADEQGWDVYEIYSDDDYTGSDRRRPAFNRLLKDAEERKFNIVLCKTQSRFTRELELVEKYIHGLFPLWGIRFVSIVDNADTANKGNKKSRQINGLVNEWYLEDMSDNIKSVLTSRRQNGFHIGAFALYGYKKDPDQKGHLIIDEEAAAVVREVFTLFSQGMGKTAIARLLNDRGIPNPTEYKRRNGLRYKQPDNPDVKLYKEFIDDGYTGSNFDRPNFQDMIDLILKGKINCVIVKDLSRFAREYIDAGYYLEKLFPAMGVRFISINDNIDYKVDSSNNTKLIVAFKNILNDSYIRDTSIKIRSHLEVKRQSGEYIGAFVVMGYQKAKDDKHKLEIDKDAAVFIKQIFSMYFMGISASAISNKLNLCGVPSPAEYKKQCGSKYKANAQKRHTARWSAKAVIRILSNPIYMGTLIQGKHTTVNYKVKKVIVKDESEWAVKYDNHEAIIPQDYFERIQHLLKQDTRVCPGNEEPYLFSGFLKCGDCGDSLIRRNNRQNGKEYVYYMCSQNKLKMGCTSHRVSETVLYTSVFTAINTYCKNVADLSERLNAVPLDKIKAVKLARIDKASYDKKMEIKDLERTIALVERRFIDKKESKETFDEVCSDIKLSIDSLEKEIAQLAVEKENIQSEVQRNMAWIQVFTENGEIKELNRLLLANLVKEIVVYEDKRIVVRFNYQDKYMQLLSLVEQVNIKEAV